VIVYDTEVYSNTGGQSSQGDPHRLGRQVRASGKKTPKKDMGQMMMSYGYVYIASVRHGRQQEPAHEGRHRGRGLSRALADPGLCALHNQGILVGMGRTQAEEELAVKSATGRFTATTRSWPRKQERFHPGFQRADGSLKQFLEARSATGREEDFPEEAERCTHAERVVTAATSTWREMAAGAPV